ncbi:hypothetical protein HDC94_002737 [Leifsonia sp. AK011]|uniref:hypothetical protein n=1 Tax=Leifsonia sp. AK011 TaxID=2723075 RepID=UPI0015C7699C|nr:hypothetical protein [Leifsonia sp. AK011]NYF11581.1 hypothetical protein [Leifsonia sp. AK011]
MSAPRLVAAVAVVLLLAGCGPTAPQATPTPTPTPTISTPSPTPEAPAPAALVLSLDALTLQDQNGAALESAPLADPDAAITLVSSLTGMTPDPEDNGKFGMSYEWPEIRLTVNFSVTSVRVMSATVAGLPVSTSQGIHVGSSRSDVVALDPFVQQYDGDADGLPDIYGLEPVSVPEHESLSNPGNPGTDYIAVFMSGDTVASLGAPGGDYRDI